MATAASVMIARRAGDNNPIRNRGGSIVGQDANVSGRTLGGGFGFGLDRNATVDIRFDVRTPALASK